MAKLTVKMIIMSLQQDDNFSFYLPQRNLNALFQLQQQLKFSESFVTVSQLGSVKIHDVGGRRHLLSSRQWL